MNDSPEGQLPGVDGGPEMPALLGRISICGSLTLLALSWATAWLWFPNSIWGKVGALLLLVAAAPPITAVVVLEVADRLSGGELRRTGSMKRQRT
jgi:hypothetical protein